MALTLIAILGTLLLLAARWGPRRASVVAHPARRAWLHGHGLIRAADFLALPETRVGGHPGRHVSRVELPEGGTAYLKRDACGEGPLREARTLQALERDGIPAPRWLAAGSDEDETFLLLEAVEGTTLADALADPARRRPLARAMGRLLARLHDAGWVHADLWSKHVLVDAEGGLVLLDWQRARRSESARLRDLASLDATLDDSRAGLRDRLALLRAYLGKGATVRPLAASVRALSLKLLQRRHVREKRCLPASGQSWKCLDGAALCVAPALGEPPPWLRLEAMDLLPGVVAVRRWVELQGRRCLLLRRRGVPSQMRAANLLWRLERHGVPCPQVLAAGERGADSFLLVEPPADTVCLPTWLRRPSPRREAVLAQAAELLARMHEGCCYLGPKGMEALAVQSTRDGPRVVLARADGVCPSRCPNSAKQRRDEAVLRSIGAPVGQSIKPAQVASPSYDAAPRRQETMIMSVPRSTLWQRWRIGCWRTRHRADWPLFAGEDWLDRLMDAEVTDRFHAKQGRSTGRCVLEAQDGSGRTLVVYLKRHYKLPWLHRLGATLFPGSAWSPARQEAANLEWARQQGVPVPEVVAAGEYVGPGGLQSFLAVEELTGMMAVNEALPLVQGRLAPDAFSRWKRGLVVEMARLSRLLHDRHRFHKDLYLCHFYIREEDMGREVPDWRGRVSLIDLHRLKHHPITWRVWRLKDLAQLLYSSEVAGITDRDRIAFWRAYRGPGNGPRSSRWLRWLVTLKWRRYRQHNLRKKAKAEGGAK